MPLLPLLRRPPIAAIWTAQLLSVLGDRFYALAIMWLALERSGPIAMGLVAIVESVPFILIGAFGGRLLERCASFRILAGVDAARALLVLGVPVAWSLGGTPAMLVIVGLLGTLAAVFDPSLGALVPDLVGGDERQALVAAMDLNGRIARIAGPALAGVLLVFTPVSALFAADAVTFSVSVLALGYLARTAAGRASSAAKPATSEPERARARTLLRQRPDLAAAFAVHGAGFFLNAVPGIGLPLLLAHQLGAGPAAYGWVLTATGTAALAGNLVAARLRPPARFLPRFCAAWAVAGILLVATGAANSLPLVILFAAMSGAVSPMIAITLGTQLASHAYPARLRLLTVNHVVMRTTGTAGMAIIPALLAPAPSRGFIVGGTVLAVVAITAWAFAMAAARMPQTRSVRVVEAAAAPTTRTGSPGQAV